MGHRSNRLPSSAKLYSTSPDRTRADLYVAIIFVRTSGRNVSSMSFVDQPNLADSNMQIVSCCQTWSTLSKCGQKKFPAATQRTISRMAIAQQIFDFMANFYAFEVGIRGTACLGLKPKEESQRNLRAKPTEVRAGTF
ncbi:unnamed protein product [Hermetia illucens]|uniref:Uncharacterized protein n=1 Tax=Hermetia illucens TaxID=343691 RepID=A0A7R8YS01_HERIL|nr:unnamed protein product [Hermetia illucens]